MELRNSNYYQVLGWMRNELQLKGTELVVYAIVYGFSQDGASQYQCGQDYMADFVGVDRRTITRAISSLVEKNLIRKETTIFGNDIYRITEESLSWDKMSHRCDKLSHDSGTKCPINNNKDNIINTTTTKARTREEEIFDWLTDDEHYLESNLRSCNLIQESKTSEELKKIARKYITAYTKDLIDRGDDLYTKTRQEVKRHFHLWLPKSYKRVNEQVDFPTFTKAFANNLKWPHKPVAQIEIQGNVYYTFEDVAIENNLRYFIYHTPAEERQIEKEKEAQAEREREEGRAAAEAFFAKYKFKGQ